MAAFAAVAWRRSAGCGPGLPALIDRSLAGRGDWRLGAAGEGIAILLRGARPPALRSFAAGRGWVVGELIERASGRPAPARLPATAGGPEAQAAALLRDYWGGYVALWAEDGEVAALRDPSGVVEALRWRVGEALTVVASEPVFDLPALAPQVSIDEAAAARLLYGPSRWAAELGLRGLDAAHPGELLRPGAARTRAMWSPVALARDPVRGAQEDALVAVVDHCVGALARARPGAVAELSGGVDSAIVAAALARAAPGAVRQWAHFHARDPAADERRYARAVAARLGAPLAELAKPEAAWDEAELAGLPVGLRPSVNGLDAAYDRDLARLAADLQAPAILTGQGGDAVFLQATTALALLDAPGLGLAPRAWARALCGIARWSRRSVWSVAGEAFRARRRGAPPALPELSPFASQAARRLAGPAAPHPWLTGLKDVAPAKPLQIQGLVYAQAFRGASRRGAAVDLTHPLLAQPLVELCLRIPVSELTRGGRGRALARAAFAERLPPEVVGRRDKGDLTAYYGRMLARSLPALRPWLLSGRLAGRGLLDLQTLDAALTVEELIWRGDYGEILQLMAVEAWLRAWEARLAAARAR